MHKHNFGQTLELRNAVVTVNIRSRSLKSNSLFFCLQTNYMYQCKFGAEKTFGSEDKFSGINLPVHRVSNISQLALSNFHFGLWSSVEKVFCSIMIGK